MAQQNERDAMQGSAAAFTTMLRARYARRAVVAAAAADAVDAVMTFVTFIYKCIIFLHPCVLLTCYLVCTAASPTLSSSCTKLCSSSSKPSAVQCMLLSA